MPDLNPTGLRPAAGFLPRRSPGNQMPADGTACNRDPARDSSAPTGNPALRVPAFLILLVLFLAPGALPLAGQGSPPLEVLTPTVPLADSRVQASLVKADLSRL